MKKKRFEASVLFPETNNLNKNPNQKMVGVFVIHRIEPVWNLLK